MSDTIFILETKPFKELRLSGERTFRKELIFEGEFVKGDQEFAITEKNIDEWIANFEKSSEAGIELPLQSQHDVTPEATRGKVIGLEKATNEEGKVALYGFLQFRDEEAEKMALTAQVSIYSVSSFKDGVGNEYSNILRHVALCIDPVIPNLEEFQEIAASLSCKKEKKKMSKLFELAQKLDLSLADDSTDEQSFESILAYVGKITNELSELKEAFKPFKKKDGEGDEDEEKKKAEAEKAASLAASFAKIEGKSRVLMIDNLLGDGKVTKVVADDLKKSYCSKELALSFSGGEFKDGFDNLMNTLGKNDRVLSFTENSGGQVSTDTDNPLIADAEARAKN